MWFDPLTEWYYSIGVVFCIGFVVYLLWLFRTTFINFDMMDWLHWVSIVICIAQMSFILWYYVPLKRGMGGDTFISDFLFSDSVYRSVMTFFVALQLGVCALFVTRLRRELDEGPFVFCVEITLFVCAWVGWTTLCSKYSNPDGDPSFVHFAGVGIFVSCSLLYVFMMVWHVFCLMDKREIMTVVEFCVLLLLLASSTVLGLHFISNALNKDPDAWITEHLAFVLFVACHMLLFVVDSNRQTRKNESFRLLFPSGLLFDGVRIRMGCRVPLQ